MTLQKGYRLKEFEIKRVLGQGGFGITYLAIDTNLQKEVAIKEFFPRELVDREETTESVSLKSLEYDDRKKALNQKKYNHFLEKFKKEAQIMSSIEHPNIVKVIRILHENNTSYFVMNYIEGDSLKEYVKRVGSLTQEQIIEIVMPILEGLKIVHSRNFLHRDIAPDNILLTKGSGKPMLIDFGAAKNTVRDSDGTEFSIGVIKNGYSAPEQHSEESIHTSSTDIYAVGAVIAFMVSGGEIPPVAPKRLLYRDKDPLEEFLEKYTQHYTQGFIKSILRAMSLIPQNRFQKISELQKALITKRISLKEYVQINGDSLNEEKICEVINPLLQKVEILHKDNATHGNLSPESIYIKDNNIIELGRPKEGLTSSSKSLASSSNLGYSAPEQYSTDLKDTKSTDIYAVGAVMLFMITDKHPTEATKRLTELYSREDSVKSILDKHKNSYSKEFLEIIKKAMSLNPSDRFQSILSFRQELNLEKTVPPPSQFKWKRLLGGVALLTLIFIGYSFFREYLNKNQEEHNVSSVSKDVNQISMSKIDLKPIPLKRTREEIVKEELKKIENQESKVTSEKGASTTRVVSQVIVMEKETLDLNENGIYLQLTYPKIIQRGESVFLEAFLQNNGKAESYGGITLSFPPFSSLNIVENYNDFLKLKFYTSLDKVWSKSDKKRIHPKYFMIESNEEWKHGEKHEFSITINDVPTKGNEFKVYVRGSLKKRVVPTSGVTDQQGYFSKVVTIKIID